MNALKKNIIKFMAKYGLLNGLSDRKYLELVYEARVGYPLNLDKPETFNQKLQWLKIYSREPKYKRMVDKYDAKEYVKELIGDKYIIPTLGVWDRFEQIDFDLLPNKFVLKCTHDSGGLVICKDKKQLNIDSAKKKINRSLKKNYYWLGREWVYKDLKHRIIAEKYMENADGTDIKDYKLQCFNGHVDNILVCVDRFSSTGVKYHYFDRKWNYIPYCPYEGIDNDNVNVERPKNLDEMIEIAEKLSADLPQLRVDLYEINGKVFFGEMTFYSQSGFDTDITHDADKILGRKLTLKS